MDKVGVFFITSLLLIPLVLFQGWVGYLLLDDVFHLGYGVWVSISLFLNMFAPFAAFKD